jgi:hypothetical protein
MSDQANNQLYGNDNSRMFTDDFTKRTANDLVYVFYDIVWMLLLVSPSCVMELTASGPICIICILHPQ